MSGIPSNFTVNMDLSGTTGMNADLAVTSLPTIVTQSTVETESTMTTQSTLKTDSSLAITQIPEIDIGITKLPEIKTRLGFLPTRIHFPMNIKYAICAMGTELVSFHLCGESMVIIEDYHPHQTERCR